MAFFKRIGYILILLYSFFNVYGQGKHTLSGYVRDAATGEELIGATITMDSLQTGTSTNQYGYYALVLPEGRYSVTYRYIGYSPVVIDIVLSGDIQKNIILKQSSETLEEVVVSGEASDRNIRSAEMGVEKITTKQLQAVPVIFGEQDILKSIQLLPGISAVGEGNSGFYVRGGDASQNLILLDEAPVYNASHLLGFFSVFNNDAIKDVKIMKGSMPAQYGGRLSSVLDIKMKEGNNQKLTTSGGIGLISSRFQVEGPLLKQKGSFMVTGRRTYADLFLKFFSDTNLNSNVLYFYDLNAKANYRFSDKDRLFLSGYLGRDIFKFRKTFGFDWGNRTLSMRWNHIFNSRLFLNSSLIYSNYDYKFNLMFEDAEFTMRSAITDFNWKEDFQYYFSAGNTLKFGTKLNYHRFLPGEVSSSGDFPVNDTKLENKYALESALYISHEMKLFYFMSANYGLRFSAFTQMGPGSVYSFDSFGNVIDTLRFDHMENIKTYYNLDPRVTLTFQLSDQSSVKTAYMRTHQYLHLLSNTTSATPIDLWVPSSRVIRPQTSDQVSIGYFRNFRQNQYEASMEIYYRKLYHQIDYKNGADIFLNDLVETQLVFGSGQAYGMELFFRKNYGKWHGWLSYTLARSLRRFPDINNGNPYPARQDRIHDISVVSIWEIGRKWSLSAVWVYYTGDAVTFPSGKYLIENQYVNYYTERNGSRMPDYHRMDLGITYHSDRKKKWQSGWNFSIYNVYGRKNAYSITFESDKDNPQKTEAVKLYLFSVIPSITYNFKF
ncbi:MAG: TonB-dependent receptor [Chlorobi bacterium]|nr:TonB-dependent receptor [Chlorobiota bacterium]